MGAGFKKPDFEPVREDSADTEENQRLDESAHREPSSAQIQNRLTQSVINLNLYPIVCLITMNRGDDWHIWTVIVDVIANEQQMLLWTTSVWTVE